MSDVLTLVTKILTNLPQYTDQGAKIVGYASAVAMVTPWKWDNKIVRVAGVLVNALALNFKNARNVAPPKTSTLTERKYND